MHYQALGQAPRRYFTVLLTMYMGGCVTPARTDSGNEHKIGAAPKAIAVLEEPLGMGDVIELKVFREPDLTGTFAVGPTGFLDVPLIGRVHVLGKSADAVAEEVRTRLAKGYLTDPHVSVFVKEHNAYKVHVLGQVAKTGTFEFKSGMSVIEAIATAGGFTRLAATNSVKVTRLAGGEEQTIEVRAGDIGNGGAPNFLLEPGDIVFVPEAIF